MSFSVASNILRGAWLIERSVAHGYLPIVAGVIKGKMEFDPLTDEERKALQPYQIKAAMNGNGQGTGETTQSKNFAIMPVIGTLMKNTELCGALGMMDLAKKIEDYDNDRSIDGIILKIDSPGGMVSGAQTLADAILKCSKPVIAYIQDGMCASAAYWIASCCDEIISSHETNTIGSIGVYTTLADFKSYYENEGLPIHEIYATPSTEKNKAYLEAMKGNYVPMQKDSLDFIANKFIETVKANREGKLNLKAGDPFKGDTYYSNRAIEIGLVDKIGGFDDVINSALLMCNEGENDDEGTEVIDDDLLQSNAQPNLNLTNTDMKMKILSSQAALAALLAVSFAQGETEREVELTDAHLASINGKLVELTAGLETANASLAEKNKLIVNQATKISTLEANAAAPNAPAAVTATTEGAKSEDKADNFTSETDALFASIKANMGSPIPTA